MATAWLSNELIRWGGARICFFMLQAQILSAGLQKQIIEWLMEIIKWQRWAHCTDGRMPSHKWIIQCLARLAAATLQNLWNGWSDLAKPHTWHRPQPEDLALCCKWSGCQALPSDLFEIWSGSHGVLSGCASSASRSSPRLRRACSFAVSSRLSASSSEQVPACLLSWTRLIGCLPGAEDALPCQCKLKGSSEDFSIASARSSGVQSS